MSVHSLQGEPFLSTLCFLDFQLFSLCDILFDEAIALFLRVWTVAKPLEAVNLEDNISMKTKSEATSTISKKKACRRAEFSCSFLKDDHSLACMASCLLFVCPSKFWQCVQLLSKSRTSGLVLWREQTNF